MASGSIHHLFKVWLFPVHSPLLGESFLLSFPPPSDMLKFSGWFCIAEVKDGYGVQSQTLHFLCGSRTVSATTLVFPCGKGLQSTASSPRMHKTVPVAGHTPSLSLWIRVVTYSQSCLLHPVFRGSARNLKSCPQLNPSLSLWIRDN